MNTIDEVIEESDAVFLDSGVRSGFLHDWFTDVKEARSFSTLDLDVLKEGISSAARMYDDLSRDDVFVSESVKRELATFTRKIRQQYLRKRPWKAGHNNNVAELHRRAFRTLLDTHKEVLGVATVYAPTNIRAFYEFFHAANSISKRIRQDKRDASNSDELLIATAYACSLERQAPVGILSCDSDIYKIVAQMPVYHHCAVSAYLSADGVSVKHSVHS